MDIIMNDEHIVSIAQLTAFLKGVDGTITFSPETGGNKNKQLMYEWIGRTLGKFRYFRLRKKEKRVVINYLKKVTKLSRTQIKKLIARKKAKGILQVITETRNVFPTVYSTTDIARLIETDNAHGRISGEATKRILEREYLIFGKLNFERVCRISVAHLYRFRKNSNQYKSHVTFVEKTKATDRNIGIRKKPETFGKPGFLRVDTVHQGDLDKQKGVYHINLVDEVTQWEVIGCVEGISETFLAPLLAELMERFPFAILGFHTDNGGEYINKVVAKLLEKLFVEQTKSRSRRTNDNALAESKNGSRIRKFMGYIHIPRKHAEEINAFYRDFMDEYNNFHRPCGFGRDATDKRGKVKKVYDIYLTPYEKFVSLPDWQKYLKPEVAVEHLKEISVRQSDNECGEKLQKAKSKLFKIFTR